MGIFFEAREPDKAELRDVIEEALIAQPRSEAERTTQREALVRKAKPKKPGAPKPAPLVGAVCLLALFAVLAWLAEKHGGMPTATDSLWTAFQSVLTIVLGFIGGEASGTASS